MSTPPPPPALTLYAFHGLPSSNPLKIAILLEELGLEYEIASLDRAAGEQRSAAHTARHPNGKVPVLADAARGVEVWESLAIATHLVEEYDTERRFSSDDKQEKLDLLAWYSLQSTALAPISHLHLRHGTNPLLTPARPFFRAEILRLLRLLDARLAASPSGYIHARGYSYADMGWAVYTDRYVRAGIGFSLEEEEGLENVRRWADRVYSREAVRRAYGRLGLVLEEGEAEGK